VKSKKTVLVVGGGPAGLMASWVLSEQFEVHLFEKEKMAGQKFLLAGKGGFNLTNKLAGDSLALKYSPEGFLDNALKIFDSQAFRGWLLALGIPTWEGSSGRVFPEKGISPSRVLKKILDSLKSRGVIFHLNHKLESFNLRQEFTFSHPGGTLEIIPDYAVLALGGASWASTGSDGKWIRLFKENQVETVAFQSSNCGVNINWPDNVKSFHSGKPLKNIVLGVNGKNCRGEALITDYGLEGNAIYPLIPEFRNLLNQGVAPTLTIDFKPLNTLDQLFSKAKDIKAKTASYVSVFNLNSAFIAVIKAYTNRLDYEDPAQLASKLKCIEIPVISLRPVEEAISTVGGLSLEEINPDFSLKKCTKIFAAGEMLDWDAPTGGFLLQGSFSMGYFVGQSIINRETGLNRGTGL